MSFRKHMALEDLGNEDDFTESHYHLTVGDLGLR